MEINFDELGMDELILKECYFHIERMDDDHFWLCASSKEHGYFHIDLMIEKGKLIAKVDRI